MENGFLNPVIILYQGQVLDGWHRYQAALTLDRVGELTFKEFDGESPLTYIVSLNSRRRHLTPPQRAAIAVKHTVMLEHGGDRKSEQIKGPDGPLKTIDEVAKVAGVSRNTVKRVKKALEIAPEKADEMISGETTPTKVIKEHKEHVSVDPPEFAEKVYDILYVDPPWDYKGQSQHAGTGEDLTGGR